MTLAAVGITDAVRSEPAPAEPEPAVFVAAPGEPGWVNTAQADLAGAAADAELARLAAEEAARVEAERWAVIEARWIAVGRCEQPGAGWMGVAWDTTSSTFSGGLGFYNGTWTSWGGGEFAPNAGLATPRQQMIVAERVMGSVGRGAWGCPVP